MAALVTACGSSEPAATPSPSVTSSARPTPAADPGQLAAISNQLDQLSGDKAFISSTSKLRDDSRTASTTASSVRNAHTAIIRALQGKPQNCSGIRSAISAATPIAASGDGAAATLRSDAAAVTTATSRLRPQWASTNKAIDLQLARATSTSGDAEVVQELTTDKTAAQAIQVNLDGADNAAKTANGKATSLTAGVGRLRALQKKLPKTCG